MDVMPAYSGNVIAHGETSPPRALRVFPRFSLARALSALLGAMLLTGCEGWSDSGTTGPAMETQSQQSLLRLARSSNPRTRFLAQIELALPGAIAELRENEAVALKHGRPLTQAETRDARAAGVRYPERIRIYETRDIPVDDADIAVEGEVAALTAIYGIYLHPALRHNPARKREVLVHEFVHVWQFETHGVKALGRRFLIERNLSPHGIIPLEREAIIRGTAIYDDPNTEYAG